MLTGEGIPVLQHRGDLSRSAKCMSTLGVDLGRSECLGRHSLGGTRAPSHSESQRGVGGTSQTGPDLRTEVPPRPRFPRPTLLEAGWVVIVPPATPRTEHGRCVSR